MIEALTEKHESEKTKLESKLESTFAERLTHTQTELKSNYETKITTLETQVQQLQTQNASLTTASAASQPTLPPSAPATKPTPTLVFRQWTGSNGRKAEMAFLRRDENSNFVFLNKKNKVFVLPLSRLNADDQNLIKSLGSEPGK